MGERLYNIQDIELFLAQALRKPKLDHAIYGADYQAMEFFVYGCLGFKLAQRPIGMGLAIPIFEGEYIS